MRYKKKQRCLYIILELFRPYNYTLYLLANSCINYLAELSNGVNWSCCQLHIDIIQSSYISIANLTYQKVSWWFTAGFLLAQRRQSHLKITRAFMDIWQTSETSYSKSNFHHQYLPELIVNVYSSRLMVKKVCLIFVCVEATFGHKYVYLLLS